MNELFRCLNIKPQNLNIYKQAFAHPSYVNELHLKDSYQRLEFLGDAVVDLIISDYLYNNYELVEGEMSKVRAKFVCEKAFYTYAKDLMLDHYLKAGKGETEIYNSEAVISDIFESLMGAIYLDLGYTKVKEVVLNIIVPYMRDKEKSKDFLNDYKTTLQELLQSDQRDIKYNVVKEEGPAHSRIFTVEVKIDNITYGNGAGTSKKHAEQEAAKEALEKLVRIKNEN